MSTGIKKFILIVVVIISAINAEYRSGLFLFEGIADSAVIDFSEITDSCSGNSDCPVIEPDVEIAFFPLPSHIKSQYGIIDYGVVDFHFNEMGWYMYPDSIEKFTSQGDSLIEALNVTAPQEGYTDSIQGEFRGHLYIMKTSESHYALLLPIAQYYGGINRYQFFWAYQTDSTGVFDPQTPIKIFYNCIRKDRITIDQSQNHIIISSASLPIIFNAMLYDMRGKVITRLGGGSSKRKGFFKIAVPDGIYILKIDTSGGYSFHDKIIVK